MLVWNSLSYGGLLPFPVVHRGRLLLFPVKIRKKVMAEEEM
jgi:hypothetical protein